MKYTERIIAEVQKKDAHHPNFIQAVTEVLESIDSAVEAHPEYEEASLLERLVEPERIVMFRVPWIDDKGKIQVNRGFRVQFNSALGPYKGGLRFHPSVSLDTVKFLAFEQTFKNSLTTLPMGGGKGGSDFNPKGKSDNEVMRFCQSFMTELSRHIGADTDVPAGDIGVGAREIGYLFGQYKRISNQFTGVLTGKGLDYGGSLARTEATGYGAVYILQSLLQDNDLDLAGKTVIVSGSGNVALYMIQKLQQLGAKPVTASDSDGWVYDKDGIDFELLQEIKEVKRGRVSDYAQKRPSGQYHEGKGVWSVKADIAMPGATQNELDLDDAKTLVANGIKALVEVSNMPLSLEAIKYVQEQGILYLPSKAANAGGVATSGLEMSQNSLRLGWSFEEVDLKLKHIMQSIYHDSKQAAELAGQPGNFLIGANIAGFNKVAHAMMAQGAV